MPQRDTFLIMGLHRKRARIAGEIEAAERRLAPKREALAQVDALIRLFDPQTNPELIPAIRPASRRCMFFRHGEMSRLCRDALREAQGPLRARAVAEYALAAKGLEGVEPGVRGLVVEQVRVALYRLAKRGAVQRVVREPEVWWEVVTP